MERFREVFGVYNEKIFQMNFRGASGEDFKGLKDCLKENFKDKFQGIVCGT